MTECCAILIACTCSLYAATGGEETLRLNWGNGFINYKHVDAVRAQLRRIFEVQIGRLGPHGYKDTLLASRIRHESLT
jgi:hypothetical protein